MSFMNIHSEESKVDISIPYSTNKIKYLILNLY